MSRCGRAALLCALACLSMASAACRRSDPSQARAPEDAVYRLSLSTSPATLDPARVVDVDSDAVARRLYNGLVKFDVHLKPVPDLAAGWEISSDGRTYTFHLRENVLFHHGREMTSEDVRYSFERLLRKETMSHRAWVMEPIAGSAELRDGKAEHLSGLETPDRYTVRITLRDPFSLLLSHLAMTNAGIIPREEVERDAPSPFGRRPVGTGPFRLSAWRDNEAVELVRNEQYFAGAPALKGIRFRIIKEPLVAYQEYLAGHLEHCVVPEGYLEKIRQGSQRAELRSTPTLSTYYIGMTLTHEPLGSNLHLRRAMSYAIDRQFICEKILGGGHVPARGLLPPGLPGYDAALEGYPYDPARAQQELTRAGYGPGKPPPELTLFFRSGAPGVHVAQAVQADLKKAGIPAVLRSLDMGALLKATNDGEPDLFRLAWIADFPDADNFLQLFHSAHIGSQGNRSRYKNPQVDALLNRKRVETNPDKRLALVRQAESLIVADAPWIFLSHGQTHLLVKRYVRDLVIGPMDAGSSVNQVDFAAVSFR